jgi:peroxin-2
VPLLLICTGWGAQNPYDNSDSELPDTARRTRNYKLLVYTLVRRLELLYQAASIINFIAFLYNGRYRSLVERLLSIKLYYIQSRALRQISFEFQNQQIAW